MATIIDPSTIDFSKFLYMEANGIIPEPSIMPYIKYKDGNTRVVVENKYANQPFDDSLKAQISSTGTDWQFMLSSGYFTDNINRMIDLGIINLQPTNEETTDILKQYKINDSYITSNLIKADPAIDTIRDHQDFLYKGKNYDNWQYIPFYTYGDFESINENNVYNYSVNFDETNHILKIIKMDINDNVIETKEYPFDKKINHLYMLGSELSLTKSPSDNLIDNFTSKVFFEDEDCTYLSSLKGNVTKDSDGNLTCTKEQFNLFNNWFSMIESEHKWYIDSTPNVEWTELKDNITIRDNQYISWNIDSMPSIIKKYLKPQSRKNHYILQRNKDEIRYSSKYKMFPFYNKDSMSDYHHYIYEKNDYRTINMKTGSAGQNNFVAYYKFTPVIDLIFNETWNLFPWQSLGQNKTTDCYDTSNRIYYTGDKAWIEKGYNPYWIWDKRFNDYKCGMWSSVIGEFSLSRGYDFSQLEDYSNGYYTLNTNTITETDVENVRTWSSVFSTNNLLEIINKYPLANIDGSLVTKKKDLSERILQFLNNNYYVYGNKITEQELLTFLLTYCSLTNNLKQVCTTICTQYNKAQAKVFSHLTKDQFYAVMSTIYIKDEQGKYIVDSFYYNSNTKEAVQCPCGIDKPFTTCTYDKVHLCGSVYQFYIKKKNLPLIEFVII